MELLNQLPESIRGLAWAVFGVLVSVGAAFAYLRGKKEGPPAPKVQEFYASGQLADMGPVKELIEQTGLLVQQQVRTNMHLERCAVAMERVTAAYEGHLADERNEAEIEAEVERRLDRQLKERRARARRKPSPKPA